MILLETFFFNRYQNDISRIPCISSLYNVYLVYFLYTRPALFIVLLVKAKEAGAAHLEALAALLCTRSPI